MRRSARELLPAAVTLAHVRTTIAYRWQVFLGRQWRPALRHANSNRTRPEECVELSLNTVHRVRIRPLRPADRDRYVTAVAALSPRSRYLRFASPLPRMSKRQVDLMMQVDGERHVAYAALTPDEAVLLGVARYIKEGENPDVAEVAIAVADDWQRRGLGRILMARLIEHARSADLRMLVAMILGENRAAAELSRAAGFAVSRRDGTCVHYEMPFRPGRGPFAAGAAA